MLNEFSNMLSPFLRAMATVSAALLLITLVMYTGQLTLLPMVMARKTASASSCETENQPHQDCSHPWNNQQVNQLNSSSICFLIPPPLDDSVGGLPDQWCPFPRFCFVPWPQMLTNEKKCMTVWSINRFCNNNVINK